MNGQGIFGWTRLAVMAAAMLALLFAVQTFTPRLLEANSPPAAPSSVTLTRADGTVTASWPQVSNAASYHVTYSSDGENSWTAAPCGNNCTVGNNAVAVNEGVVSITISGVDNAKTYVVGVRASDNGGQWSGWTNSAPIASQLPDAPASVTLTRAAGQLTVAWTAVSEATSYNINLSADGTNSWTRAVSGATGAGNTISNTITSDVVNGLWYIAGVQAVNDKGAGGWANSDFVAPIYSPGPVGSLSAERSGTGISVTWTAPANNGGSAITGYDVNYTVDGVHSWMRAHTGLGASTTSATIPNVSNAVDYVVAVRANNGVGDGGAWTNSVPVAGLAGPDLVGAYKGTDYIDGGWTTVPGATGYDVNLLYFQNQYHYRIETNMTGTSRRIYIKDGADFSPEQFVIAVRARNAHGPGAWANSPPAVGQRTLSASNVTATTATLTVSPYPGAWYYQATAGPDTTCQGPVAATSKDLTGLTAGMTHSYAAYRDSACTDGNELATASAFTPGVVSVSNLGETTYGSDIGVKTPNAIAFTTGSAAVGYALRSVTLDMNNRTGNTAGLTVEVRAVSGSNPAAAALTTLSGPTPTSAGQYTYVCSANCGLAKDTTYFLTLASTNVNHWNYQRWNATSSDAETADPDGNGWTIANIGKSETYIGSGSWDDVTYPVTKTGKFRVTSVAGAGLGVTDVTSTAATLNVSNHASGWWHQGSQDGASCASVASGTTTASLSNLTADTSYTYTAYDKSGCNAADAIAAVTFSTPAS